IRAFGTLFGDVLEALIWLEEVASSMPEVLYDQSGVHNAVLNARAKITAAGAWTEAEEQQANLMREREAELGPDLPSREEREADAIASEFVDKEPEGVPLQEEIDRS